QRVAIHVGIVCQEAAGIDRERIVLGNAETVVSGRWRIVYRRDGDRDRRGVRAQRSIGGMIGERIVAVVIGRRDVSERAVPIEREIAVRGAALEHGRDGVSVYIGIICQDSGGVNRQSIVLDGGEAIVSSDWGIVYGRHRERDGCRTRAERAIGGVV